LEEVMKMNEIKLKPCPFCGGEVLGVHLDYMIKCRKCRTIFVQPQSKIPKSMTNIWNNRKENENEID